MTESDTKSLWAGHFGDAYTDRNADAETGRGRFWTQLINDLGPKSALEVGCNRGANLRWVAESLGQANVAGVDVNKRALELLRERLPGVDPKLADGAELPFETAAFDLVFTMGVLIHQRSGDRLEPMMSEIVRCTRDFVVAGEYYSEEPVEVPYRDQREALFKRDFGALYLELFPELELVDRRFLSEDDGRWDDLTVWVLRKRARSAE
jgi:pseudaminic acid biosynthesis-associated methylase